MAVSIFELFSIGIGPSSSHTVGPMRAAKKFISDSVVPFLDQVASIKVDLYGSLALTGKGHGTDIAVMLGLVGESPEGVDPDSVPSKIEAITKAKTLQLAGLHKMFFDPHSAIVFHKDKQLPFHPNGMRFTVYQKSGKELMSKVYYSVGGGFIVDHESASQNVSISQSQNQHSVPYPFKTAQELLSHCTHLNASIAQVMLENEKTWRDEEEIRKGLLTIWQVMKACVHRGCQTEGILPGGLGVKRRAHSLYQTLMQKRDPEKHPAELMEWISVWALAVNEENASGGRVVTAPTNGASGIIPAVIYYLMHFCKGTDQQVVDFLLTAGAIGILYKIGASISAAEMGCMGEVGVACSMAAAGLTAAQGGSAAQIENAAEIGMEHNLGLTCDPVKGLVQIPCIERNTMGAIKAINASLLALQGDGTHRVSLDQVIATMRQTGMDMKSVYKETSLGGLAVNVPEC